MSAKEGAIENKQLALFIAQFARDKKAEKVTVLDMRKVAGFCDYFVLMSTSSLRQTNALADHIVDELAKSKVKPLAKVPGQDESGWLVLDFSGVIVHIFYQPKREFYALERLWSDAKKLRIPRKAA